MRIYSQNKGMKFCIEKYAILIMRSGEKKHNRRNKRNQNSWRKKKKKATST